MKSMVSTNLPCFAMGWTFILLALVTALPAQQRESRQGLRQPIYRVPNQRLAQAPRAQLTAERTAKAEHPLAPVVGKAKEILQKMRREVKDYSATLVKRERIDGKLLGHQYIATKIRHEQKNSRGQVVTPFSVYMNFLAPDDLKGRECLWVKGRNDNKLIAHDGGTGLIAAIKSAVTVTIEPDSDLAMEGNKYPITDVGMENLLEKLITVASGDMKHDASETQVEIFNNTKINGRNCTCLQSVHPEAKGRYTFYIARIYLDDELQIPIRYESYGWPTRRGEEPPLLEEYTYVNVKLNNGFTDRDFDRKNAGYNFN